MLISGMSRLVAILALTALPVLAQQPFGFRSLDYDAFDRADAFIYEHNVAHAAFGTTVTLREPGTAGVPAPNVNDGLLQEHRTKICQLPGNLGELEFHFAKPTKVHAVRVFSGDLPNNWDLPGGDRSIKRFRVEGMLDGKWITLTETTGSHPSYSESTPSTGVYTHHAVLTFSPTRLERLRVLSLESNDNGKRVKSAEIVPVEKRCSLVREVEIFSNAAELGPVTVPLKRLVETDWTLPAYLNMATANLLVLPRPRLKESTELQVGFHEEKSGTVPAPPLRLLIRAEEKPQRFPVDIADWPDGDYITTIRQLRADGKNAGELKRKLIKQTIAKPQPPAGPIPVKGIAVIPVDHWYFAEVHGLKRQVHPADQFPIIEKPLTPDRVRVDGLSLKLNQAGNFEVEVEDMDRWSQNPQRHILSSKDAIHWSVEPPKKKTAEARTDGAEGTTEVATGARFLFAAALNTAPKPTEASTSATPNRKVLPPDDNQAKWKYQEKNAPIAAKPHRYYDASKDGPVDLTKVVVRHSRHYPPVWGDIEIPAYTVWPVWQKAPDDYVILTREPLTRHLMGFSEEDLMDASTAGDGWWSGYPEISADKKTIYWMQYRMIPRFPPFRIAYDLARGSQRHVVLWSSQDGLNWKQTFTTLPTEGDEPGTQHYGGMILNLEGGRLKLCYQWTYKAARQQMCLDLAFSRDLRSWHQIPGPPFSPNGGFGSWNYGFATTTGGGEVDKDGYSYRLTGRDSSTPHHGWEILNRNSPLETFTGQWMEKRFDGLGMRQMPNWSDFGSYDKMAEHMRANAFRTVGIIRYRKNGWVSLQTDGKAPGSIVTRVLRAGTALSLNAKTAAGGSIRVEVLDETGNPLPAYSAAKAAVFTGDAINGKLTWADGSVTALPDQPFRLRLTLEQADLYALNF